MKAEFVPLPSVSPPPPQVTAVREDSPPEDLVTWALARFSSQRLIITTQFGMEGCALIDMCARHERPLRVVYLDTGFFFPETYQLRDRLAARYRNVSFIDGGTTLTPAQQDTQYGPELWKRDPDLCCRLRKVDPLRAALQGAEVWLTALRRSQSATRANLQVMAWDWKYQVLKISPLATWSRENVWHYIQQHQVPYNPLHERGYPTLGCAQCTSPVEGATVTTYTREGRWRGTGKTECGLHGEGI